ncbi:MAG: sigma-70 family RNA polymerase sigma factor [Planctomycetota bacterium]|jgi:RNA polymerase sigma-70 factor (ECF subfamily)
MDDESREVRRLLEQARAGSDKALDRLLDGYRNYLIFLARTGLESEMRPKADASDVVQETLLLAYRSFGQFRGETTGEFTNWLRQILARALATLVRRYRATAAREMDRERSLERILHESSIALADVLPAPGPSPSEDARRHERSVALANALERLSEDYRRVITLRSLEQRSWETIGEEMGRSPAAARMLWTRALQALGFFVRESRI